MKKKLLSVAVLLLFISCSLKAQISDEIGKNIVWQAYTWESYKTSFKVPNDFVVSESSGTAWKGANSKINLSIYPRKIDNLNLDGMDEAVVKWAKDNGVIDLSGVTDLDPEKLNGYWGVLVEGTKNDWPIGLMLINDPDYPEIFLYIWVSYDASLTQVVIDMLMTFKPM